MYRTLIKVGSRLAVIILIYLLLSIPDSRYQNDLEDQPQAKVQASRDYMQIVNHVPWLIGIEQSKIKDIYDSLNTDLTVKLSALRSEMVQADELVIDSVNNYFGMISALVGLSDTEPKVTLENLWLWKNFIKEQSLFWNLNNEKNLARIASIVNFIGLCEDFIVVNRELSYSKFQRSTIEFTPISLMSYARSGDLVISSQDSSYPYLSLSKNGLEQTHSLGLILINEDSAFYIATNPSKGLYISNIKDLSSNVYSRQFILRLRDDLPELISNPTLSHQASFFAFDLARRRSIAYDYNYNASNSNSLYETELLSLAYEGRNMDFSIAFTRLLDECRFGINKLGIEYINQSVPNELQFHPSFDIIGQQLSGKEIWCRDLEMASALAGFKNLKKENSNSLRWRLPFYRMLNGYGNIVHLFGMDGKIPSGMSSEAAIIHNYALDQKAKLLPLVKAKAQEFYEENHYLPTYSELCLIADALLEN